MEAETDGSPLATRRREIRHGRPGPRVLGLLQFPAPKKKKKVPFLLKTNVNGIMGRDNLHLKDSWPIP